MSVVFLSIGLMLATWLLVCLIGHGYANTVDHVAYLLHRHAEKVRQMHDRRKAVVAERWVRCLENCVVDVLTEIKYDKPETASSKAALADYHFCGSTLTVEGSIMPYCCTNPKGHEGQHVARLGGYGEVMSTWGEK